MLPFVLAAVAVLLFDVVREIPASYGCGEDDPPGHDAAIAAYRSGAMVFHLLTVAAALGALALLSADRGRGPLGIGCPTLIAVAVMALVALLALFPGDAAAYVLLPLIVVVVGFVVVAGPFGAQATAALAALLLLGAAAWARRAVGRGRTLAVRAALWVLVVLTGAHLLLVYIFCAASCAIGSAASSSASSRTRASSPSNGTASLISPTSAASGPDSGRPVSAYSFARREPEPVDPHAGQVGAPHPRVRRADLRVLGGDDEVGTQRVVAAAADAPAVHLGDHRLRAAPHGHELLGARSRARSEAKSLPGSHSAVRGRSVDPRWNPPPKS